MSDTDVPSITDLAADLAGEADVNEEQVETTETTSEESSSEETKEVEAEADSKEEEADQSDTDTEEEDLSPEDTEEQQPSKADERKQQLNTEIRDLVTQRRELMSEVERLNSQVYAPQTTDEIMQETGQSQAEARITAMEQRQELNEYNTRVAESQLVIGTEAERVLQDFPMFNPEDTENYRPEVANEAAELLRQNLQIDPNTGQIIGSNISPYQLYKTIASANQASAVENQIKGQRSAEKMLASADPQSSAAPKETKEDPFLAGLMKGIKD